MALKLSNVPKGWKASLKGGSFTVTGVAVPDGKTRTLSFSAEPEKGVGPGTFEFGIEGVTADGKLKENYVIAVTSRERSRLGTEDIQITTSYPVLRGQTDATFEFSLDVNNKMDADRTFTLAAQAPEKWEINFKPGYEQKQISSLRIRGNSNQTVAVSVTPPKDATAGEYPVLVRITAGETISMPSTPRIATRAAINSGVPPCRFRCLTERPSDMPYASIVIIVSSTETSRNRRVSFRFRDMKARHVAGTNPQLLNFPICGRRHAHARIARVTATPPLVKSRHGT